jgi:uncharacterized protein with HEPN domain
MAQRSLQKYLFDIIEAAHLLEEFTTGKSFDDYASSPLLRSAVERQFEIIGEALTQALRSFPVLQQHVSEVRRIIAFRNQLAHGYASIHHDAVWYILQNDLPLLLDQMERLLDNMEARQ